MHILMVFVDGVGLGPDEPNNPLRARYSGLECVAGGPWLRDLTAYDSEVRCVRAIDPNLSVDGLPQSGTGQASLFTGVNCALLAGRHYGPYPHSATRDTIARMNVFTRIKECFPDDPDPVAFANAYPDRFFHYSKRRNWWTVTTRCCLDANVPIRTAEDLSRGHALSADITGATWPQRNPPVTPITEETAADRLLALSRRHRFTLFEYYLTDKAGHAQDPERARRVLISLDALLGQLCAEIDVSRDLLIITSDHGNLEDLAVKTHTRNAVPLIALGKMAYRFSQAYDLTDVIPTVQSILASPDSEPTG